MDVEDLPELASEVGQVVVGQPPHEIVVQSAEVSGVGSVVDVVGHQTATQKEENRNSKDGRMEGRSRKRRRRRRRRRRKRRRWKKREKKKNL